MHMCRSGQIFFYNRTVLTKRSNTSDLMQFFCYEGPPSYSARPLYKYLRLLNFGNAVIPEHAHQILKLQISTFVIRSEDPAFATMHSTSVLCKLPLKDREWERLV